MTYLTRCRRAALQHLRTVRPTVADRRLQSLKRLRSSRFLLAPVKRRQNMLCERTVRVGAEKPNDRHRLRARRERPHRGRAAEQRYERAALHSITSSARSRNDSGIVSPSAWAVVRLMTRSNLVGCSIGISLGFAPRRIWSTRSAERRYRSGKF